jgi:hypothetical protein
MMICATLIGQNLLKDGQSVLQESKQVAQQGADIAPRQLFPHRRWLNILLYWYCWFHLISDLITAGCYCVLGVSPRVPVVHPEGSSKEMLQDSGRVCNSGIWHVDLYRPENNVNWLTTALPLSHGTQGNIGCTEGRTLDAKHTVAKERMHVAEILIAISVDPRRLFQPEVGTDDFQSCM